MQPDNHSASWAAGKWVIRSIHPHLSDFLLISSAVSQRECPSDMLLSSDVYLSKARDTAFITLTCKASYSCKFRTWPTRVHQTGSVHLMRITNSSKATRRILKRDHPVLQWAGQPFVLWALVKQLGRNGRARHTCSRNRVSSLVSC